MTAISTRARGGHLLRTLPLLVSILTGVTSSTVLGVKELFAADKVFIVTASRFEFTPRLLEVTVGDRVRIALRSVDVEHGFAIDAYGIETTIPASGEAVLVERLADRAGDFEIGCSVYCGTRHADMRARFVVRPALSSPVETPTSGETPESRVANVPLDIDYTLVNLSTALRLPRHKSAFWLTHRFARPLGEGNLGDLAGDLFGLDGGVQIGLGLRFGLTSSTQIAAYRTSNRTIQLFGEHDVFRQGSVPFALAVSASIEGLENFSEGFSPALTAVVSRTLGDRVALYASPGWVGNVDLLNHAGEDGSLVLGLGARLRLTENVFAVGEAWPRLAGFEGLPEGESNDPLASFGVEMRYGGHVFQLNVSNDLATTPAQIARGQQGPEGWFLGFNITRKFF